MIPPQAVEAVARAYYEGRAGSAGLKVWEDISPVERLLACEHMRAALEAAAPHMQRAVTTEAELDALPVGSIVAMIGSEPDAPAVACRAVLGWQFLGGDPERRYQSSALIPAPEPITVLHVPGAARGDD